MEFKDAVNVAVQMMDMLKLNGNDARGRGMAQAELMKAIPIIEEALKRAAKKKP